MKNFRLIVAIRLAFFPLIFNLSFAQEEGIDGGDMSFWTSMEWGEESYVLDDNLDTQDSSAKASEWQTWSEMDFSAMPRNDEQYVQDFHLDRLASEWETEFEILNIDTPNLIISEVYRLWTDEWIEITNLSDTDFSWKISLSGAKSSEYSKILNIPRYSSIILADKQEIGLIDDEIIAVNNVSFNLTDSNAISISLVYSWNIIDMFEVDESIVTWHKNKTPRPSFQKVYDNGREIEITTPTDLYNITWNYIANPWIIVIESWNPWEWDWPSDYPSAWNTWVDTPWNWNNSWDSSQEIPDDVEVINCSGVQENIITISEIYWWWSKYNPYVEFLIHEDISNRYDSLLLSWSLLTQEVSINLDSETESYNKAKLQKNTRLILTTNPWTLIDNRLITIVLHPDLEFNSSAWYLEIYWMNGQSGQVLDIVKISAQSTERSSYHNGSIHQCGDKMDNVMEFSPWFDESFLQYFPTASSENEKVVEVVKYIWWWGSCSCPSKAELCWVTSWNVVQTGNSQKPPFDKGGAEWNEAEGFNTWDTQEIPPTPLTEGGQETPEWQAVKIVSLEPKNPESITLQSFLPYDIDFKNHSYYLKTSTATTKKYIDGILHSNTIDTFTKNFWFLDAGACVYLYSWDNQLDSYCYSSNKSENEKNKQEIDVFNPSDYQLSITHINYDPDWSDAWNETITIQSNSSKSLDLSKIKMKVNDTNKKISWILDSYSSITLKWSFGFPNSTKDNSDVVVTLFYDNYIFSTYRYNPNKPKVEIPAEAVKVYSVIDGDTFRYRKEDWSLQSVRLLGVDAPESNTARYRTTECFWKEAKNYLTNLIKNQYVTLEYDSNSASSDAYGRMLAYVYLDWKLVNETLIAEWYAKEYTYKTPYTQQSAFKQAEENARKSKKWLRSSTTCGKSIEEEPEAWGIDYEKLIIKISNVIYDPDGTDEWNESVQFTVDNSQISSVSSIDFSDDFSLTVSPRSEYSTWTTKSKKLSEFWIFNISSSNITLKWNFWLPNNRATCVSLNQWSYTFDTRCYNPNWLLSDDEIEAQTGEVLAFTPNVKIQSIIPNPSWTDSWKEEITLLWIPSNEYENILDLSPDFSLLINWKTKKKLVWNLIPNQNITIKWSFWLPNSASCISLLYKWEILDEFCYWKASDGVKFNSDNTLVHEIPAEELSILKKIILVKRWDKLCISYNKTIFSCKSIPNSTTEKNKTQLSMQNTFISELENYIKSNYSAIYYNSELKDYFNLYSEAKKAIKLWSGEFVSEERNISLTDVSALLSDEYKQDAQGYFIGQIQYIFPEKISFTLHQLEEKYNKKQVKKSDLKFLSFVN